MPVRLQFVPGQAPDLLDLPWSVPLEHWQHDRLVRMARGASRHVVRFVRGADGDERVFALKETTEKLARLEYRILHRMADEATPSVEPVGIVTGRQHGEPDNRADLPAVLITRYLDYSLPYRYLFTGAGGGALPGSTVRLVDAGVILLCRLHLAGYYWGDCSLNNLLFRRDAGGFMAYLVDAETTEHHDSLTKGMRQADLDLARENVVGGLLDLEAAGRLPEDVDPLGVADLIEERYEALWKELTATDEVGIEDRHALERRIRRLNDLGFDVGELEVEHDLDGSRMLVRPALVEEGHHARELRRLTGLEVQENQARQLLNDIAGYGAWLEQQSGRPLPLAVNAARWIAEIYEPVLAEVPPELSAKREPPELFHELLTHRYYLSEACGREVGNDEALASLVAEVLPSKPDERVLTDDD